MGLYKICAHRGRHRDRCAHAWWGSFRGVRVSLAKWANREVQSKAEAGAALDELRVAIRTGTFHALASTRTSTVLTFREFVEIYRTRHVIPKRLALAKEYDWSVKPFVERFGDRPLADIKTADIQDFVADLQKPRVIGRRPGLRVLSPGRVNRIVDLLRHMLNWAVGREYIERTPFKRGSETLIKKLHDDSRRRRRIDEAEEAALLDAAPAHVQAMLIAALDTGMRQGEMLALRFGDVDLDRGVLTLRGETTKSRRSRVVPISTARLRAILAWLRRGADGLEKPDGSLVFSNEVGEPLRLFHRTWQSLVLRAHGHIPTWNPRLAYHGLSDESQEAFRGINLRWHDLRHEYASRLVEQGVPLAQVRDLLGHASITTTERYDNQTVANLKIAASKLERGRTFAPESTHKVSRIFQDAPLGTTPHPVREVPALDTNELRDLKLGEWLGRRDSNPNNRVQSAVSYR